MDSLTQILLGGAVGAIVGGRKYGRKSVLLGAICGTIPDMDVLFLIGDDPITSLTSHRGFSHSILFSILAIPVFSWLFSKIKWFAVSLRDKEIHWIVFLGLLTHMLLDSLTIYGTQLFWPLPSAPVGVGSVFIIDPLYTLPLAFGVVWFLINKSMHAVRVAIVVSTAYLVWGFGTHHYVSSLVPPAEQGRILVQTSPFNSILWRILSIHDDHYKVGYYSIFDKDRTIEFDRFDRDVAVLKPLQDVPAVQRLSWFTKGFYTAERINDDIVMTDLRMGSEPQSYIFGFIVGKVKDGEVIAIENKKYPIERSFGRLSNIWNRIWSQNHSVRG